MKWNALNQQMEFEQLAEADFGYTLSCPEEQGYNGIFWRDISSGFLAETTTCRHSGTNTLHNFWIVFDSDRNWFAGDNRDNIGSSEYDLESFAAHEVGHATGWGGSDDVDHFGEDSDECPSSSSGGDSGRHTMCPGLNSGQWDWRTLEVHDKHTFDNEYPDE